MTTTPTLSYAAPDRGKTFLKHFVYFKVADILGCGIFLIFVFYVVPHMGEVFKNFRTTLPLGTVWIFSFAAWFMNWWLWMPLLLCGDAMAVLLAFYTSGAPEAEGRKRFRRVLWGIILLFTGFMLMMGITLGLPMLKLMNSVSGGGNS
ncbi:MAG TPA: hypothetical protein VGN88_01655 [Phycisphaerae bacterium]|jgi:hypothetical protein